jgi:hypothetical protein
MLDCTKQNKVASINKHYYKAPEKFSCSERLVHASDSPNPSTRVGKVSQNMPLCVCVKVPPVDGDMFINFLLFSELN